VTSFAAVLLRLIAMTVPFAALGWWLRIYPRRPLVWLAVAPALAAFVLIFVPAATVVVIGLDGVIGLAALIDLATLPRRKSFSLDRASGRIASLQKPHAVTVTLVNLSPRRRRLALRDGAPYDLRPEPGEFQVLLGPRSRAVLHYSLRPNRRGAYQIQEVFLNVRSRLGLW